MAEGPKVTRTEAGYPVRAVRKLTGEVVIASAALEMLTTRDDKLRTLVLYLEGTPGFGLFLEMDAAKARSLGELLVAQADSFRPSQEPEVRNRQP